MPAPMLRTIRTYLSSIALVKSPGLREFEVLQGSICNSAGSGGGIWAFLAPRWNLVALLSAPDLSLTM